MSPMILLENSRTGSGVLCGFTLLTMRCIVDLGHWIVVYHPKGHPDWRYVEPYTAFAGVPMVLTVGKINRAFAVTAGQTADGRALTFPGSLLRALRPELGRREGS